MTFPLISAVARVLASIDAPRNLRALYALLAGFCLAGLLLASAQSAFARADEALGALWLGLALAVAFFGVNTTGLMLMDQARGRPVRDPQDALADALARAEVEALQPDGAVPVVAELSVGHVVVHDPRAAVVVEEQRGIDAADA